MAPLHIGLHPLGFGVIHHRLAADTGKVIHLPNIPTIPFGVFSGALQMMLGAFAFGLILSGNPNPDAHVLGGSVAGGQRLHIHGTIVISSTPLCLKRDSKGKKNVAKTVNFRQLAFVSKKSLLAENDLADLARRCREAAGRSRAEAARELKVSQTSIFHAEESPGHSLLKLRVRMIETYSSGEVVGPLYLIRPKTRERPATRPD